MSRILDGNDRINLLSNGKITNLNTLVSLLTDGGAIAAEQIYQHKDARVAGVAASAGITGMPISLWEYEGTPQTHGAPPGAFANPDNTTVGGLLQADPGAGRSKLVAQLSACAQVSGTLVLYDRLLHMSGLDATVTTAQNINGGVSADVTRYTDGVGNQLWIEIYTLIGGNSATVTAAYKDGAGNAKTTQPIVLGNTNRREAQRMLPLSLAAGGKTVKGITSVTLVGSTATAGNFGVVIAHPLIYVPLASGSMSAMITDFLTGPVAEILIDACLSMMFIPGITTAPNLDLTMTTVEI